MSTQAPISHRPAPAPERPTVPRPPGPRRRRLRWTLAVLTTAALGGIAIITVTHLRNRPVAYKPDEQTADITNNLALGLPQDAPRTRLTDVTREAGLASFRTFIGQRTSQMPEDMGPGAAWGDYDNDGDDDLFLVSAGGAMNQPREKWATCELHENLGNGTFRKVAAFPELRIGGMGAAWGDYDEDGFLDLIVTGYNALRLLRNQGGTGTFMRDERLPEPKGFWSGASWGDYDNDRHLDLYVCNYIEYIENEADIARGEIQQGSFVPFTLNPASYKGGLNLLLHNRGDGTFDDVAPQLNVQNPEGRSLGGLWHDFDQDGWLDLYVANDISDNVFYRNVGGKFEDISHPACAADYRSAMGLAAGDYNRDGDDDLYITHWVAQENALYDNVLADLSDSGATKPAATTRPALRFMDIADMIGLGQMALPYVGWGTEFADFDGDGWLDLIVANGNTLEFEGPIPRKLKPQEAFLLWNRRGEMFHNLAPLNKSLSEQHVSRGLATADYDNDGDLDVLFVDLGEGVRLLRNDMQKGHWLKVRLRSRLAGGKPLGFGDGATVIAHVGDVRLRRTLTSVSYLSQSSRTLHFGLGDVTKIDRLEVRWVAGTTQVYPALDADNVYELVEGDPQPTKLASPLTPKAASAGEAKPAQAPMAADRARLREFWNKHRAAMDAMKVQGDLPTAVRLFTEALALDPRHEDARYYLAHCLAAQGDVAAALAHLEELQRVNPRSHRAFQQWGCLRALQAGSDADLAQAERSVERAHAMNPEETGALLVLGEISLLRGDLAKAEQRLVTACQANPRAVGGFFLRGYIAWKRGDHALAETLLHETRQARGEDWQPKGSTAEGDVRRKQHVENSPLSQYSENWNGAAEPATAYAALDARLGDRH